MLLHSNLALRPRSPRAFCVGAGIVLFACAALFGAFRLNTADGGAQAAQPESATQETKPPAEKGKKPAEDDNMAAKIIRGSVVDQAGKPVAQAKLCLPLGNRPRRAAQATADDAGQFELKIPINWLNEEAMRGCHTLWAYAPGFSLAFENVRTIVIGSANELVVKIVLPPQENTSFKILAPNGDPLRGVLVQPHYYKTNSGSENFPEKFFKIIASRTNAEGMATFSALQKKHLLEMKIISEAFGHQEISVNHSVQEAIRTIRLCAPGRIEGKLIAEKPEWVRGVRLTIHVVNDEALPNGSAEVFTDDEGRYVVPAIASGGTVRFEVWIDSKLPVRQRPKGQIYLKAGETMRMDIPLVSATLLHGTILWKSSGKPVPDAEISVQHGDRQSERVKTNEKGQYEARVLPGQIGVQVNLPNWDWLICPPALTQKFPLQVPEGVSKFELPKIEVVQSRDLTGTLIGEENEPVPDRLISALHQGRFYYSPLCADRTDAAGRFKIKVPEGMESIFQVLTYNPEQQMPARVIQKNPLILRYPGEQLVDPERAKKVDVTLTGRVLSEGKPLAGVSLTLTRQIQLSTAKEIDPSGASKGGIRPVLVTKAQSDADGRYRLSGLKAGDEYTIEVEAAFPLANLDWRHHSVQTLGEQAKGNISLPDLNLRKWNQTLAGIVVDSDGKPVSGVQVRASLQNQLWKIPQRLKTGPPPSATTDSTGQFHLENLPDEPLQIVASLPPDKTQPKTRNIATLAVDKNQQNIRVVLDPAIGKERR